MQDCPDIKILNANVGQGQGGQGGQDGQGKGNFVWNSKVAAVPEGYMSVPDGYLYKG